MKIFRYKLLVGIVLAVQLLLTAGIHITTYFCTCECSSSTVEISLLSPDNDDDCCQTQSSSRVSIDQYHVTSFAVEGFWVKLLSSLFSSQFEKSKCQENVTLSPFQNIANQSYSAPYLLIAYPLLLQKCVLNI